MGFFDRLFKGKSVFEDKRNPGMVCELSLCGRKYILSEFDIAYDAHNSSKEYFEAYAVFSESLNAETEKWIAQGNRKESGVVKFYLNSDALTEGAQFEISFSNASCLRYRSILHGNMPVKTLVMAIPALKMAGEEYEVKR